MNALRMIVALLLICCANRAQAAEVYAQPHNGSGTVFKSSWYPPDGMDGDMYAYDSFVLGTGAAISEVRWRGGYTNYLSGAGKAPVSAFTISIYASGVGGFNPDLLNRLARFNITGNAGETLAGTFGGVQMFDYAYTLPTPFQAAAGTKYWILIEASQSVTPTYGWPPDWGLANATGGTGSYYRQITGGNVAFITGDLAFSLHTSGAPTVMIAASALPVEAGTVSGAGAYPINTTASLQANANAGWGFVNWTQGASPVSTNVHYTFTATADQTLVANFTPAYTVTTGSLPTYGGTTTGDGVYNLGSTVTVVATPVQGFVFAEWLDYGTPVSTSATYSFASDTVHALVAHFVLDPLSEAFDFIDAPIHTSLPIALSHGGLGAQFTATGSGFSVQPEGTVGINPPGFTGPCLFPNSVFPADLIVSFSAPLTYFSILYSPQELGCDNSATMRATVYMDGVFVATNTTTAPVPGTYPSHTLSITAPAGFNSVVVHYDARPPTCQDYGPIFLADNVIVTRACAAPTSVSSPLPATACNTGGAYFNVAGSGTGQFVYQWQRESAPGVFVDLQDGPTQTWDGGVPGVGGIVTGAGTAGLSINADTAGGKSLSAAHAIRYRCVASNACGSATSAPAQLSVVVCACNLADITEVGGTAEAPGQPDHQLTVDDIIVFVNLFGDGTGCPGVAPCSLADVCGVGGPPEPAEGQLTVDDIIAFFNAFSDGC